MSHRNIFQINNIEKEKCLPVDFFNQPCIELANNLLGKYLVRKMSSGDLLVGKIVETESYCGGEDKASHSFNNKRTPRNEPMYMIHGTIYVYFTYGMYHCFNISSREPGSAVLIRSLEPIHGLDIMKSLRNQFNAKRNKNKPSLKNTIKTKGCSPIKNQVAKEFAGSTLELKKSSLKNHDLCNGPSKLCISMDVTVESMNKKHISQDDSLWIQDLDTERHFTVVQSSRIGIGAFANEWRDKLLRFYILGNKCVSKTDKKMESLLSNR